MLQQNNRKKNISILRIYNPFFLNRKLIKLNNYEKGYS